ncbi:HpcH/HpaI aldolase/citrate lyase family protein [Isoptericola variabilis]|uniref:4-hydroxy-2-oxovalerate aldolase n=1 Tax=Isoptericola variabilis (strain 225) TaxID=743718 RepID=F6FVK7_ISOV2|nr:HpcH/HpaI aldolase/citrate lyase family protein [Isoptericola variabilis]AEG44434.1 4-hydroxy-2-oxovalerate aldolase [Isoptericola variabilis 225]TWH34427.1 4-hydroxy-2-oxoheptanedioate aldolase [Isoptericola variabilis J7]
MPIQLTPDRSLAAMIAETDRPLVGAWSSLGSSLAAEILAGSGLDVVVVDGEHGPNDLTTILGQLQATAAYPVATLVRVPYGDPVVLKQVLDLGATNVLVPMVDGVEQAEGVVRAVRYPPAGIRGVGSALARSARWNRVPDYVTTADAGVTLVVQLETRAAVADAREIAAVDGVDAVLVGPADLAASMGHPGEQEHPDVVDAVLATVAACRDVGTPVGVNAFTPAMADRYLDAGAAFVLVGADALLIARGAEALAERYAR